jgi:hypothetical protein
MSTQIKLGIDSLQPFVEVPDPIGQERPKRGRWRVSNFGYHRFIPRFIKFATLPLPRTAMSSQAKLSIDPLYTSLEVSELIAQEQPERVFCWGSNFR